MKPTRLRAWMLLAGLLFPAVLPAAGAPGGISISPVRLDMAPEQHAAAITVTNAGSDEKLIQVEAMQWSHAQGTDQYDSSRELVVNPPMFRLPPGGSQVVRVGLARRLKADAKLEKSFRLFFQELPKQAATETPQLQMLLRIGVPVFIKPVQAGAAELQWKLVRGAEGKLALKVDNRGTVHERVSAIRLNSLERDATIIEVEGYAYVLPGQGRRWTLAPPSQPLPQKLVLHAVTEGGAIHAELVLPPP